MMNLNLNQTIVRKGNFSKCNKCLKRTFNKEKLEEHIRTAHEVENVFKCPTCDVQFKQKYNLNKHVLNKHTDKNLNCPICPYRTNNRPNLSRHVESCNKKLERALERRAKLDLPPTKSNIPNPQNDNDEPQQQDGIQNDGSILKTAFERIIKNRVWPIRGSVDPLQTLLTYKNRIKGALLYELKRQGPQKFEIILNVIYNKFDQEGNKVTDTGYHRGSNYTFLREENYDEFFEESRKLIWKSLDEWMKEGSGWTIERVEKLTLKSYSYEPMGASSYIPTPMSIIGKHAIVNVQNTEDHRCFEYSVIASQYPAKDHPERTSQYEQHMGKLKACPPNMSIDDIPKFETANKLAVSVYTIAQEGKTIFPIYSTKHYDRPIINLLLIEGVNNNHYAYIKKLQQTTEKRWC